MARSKPALEPVGQLKEWTCGPASLRWILARLGLPYSESYIARRCQTTQNGTDHGALASGARSFGFRVRTGRGNLDALPRERAIVGWNASIFDPCDDHYSVIVRTTKDHVVLMDPWPVGRGAIRSVDRDEFIRRWKDRSGANNRVVSNWWMVVIPVDNR
jgi:ABC-type bacteriocin/lantibiotic exporter with double-glycine peptidase domain